MKSKKKPTSKKSIRQTKTGKPKPFKSKNTPKKPSKPVRFQQKKIYHAKIKSNLKTEPKTEPEPKEVIIHQENMPQETISDYIFSFEFIHQYPTVRSYIIKQPLKKSFKDTFFELFGSGRKA